MGTCHFRGGYMEVIKKIKSKIWIEDFIITFSYKTKRNNDKQQKRIITTISKELAERDFWLWVNTLNEDKPYRAMSNVKILFIAKENGRFIEL